MCLLCKSYLFKKIIYLDIFTLTQHRTFRHEAYVTGVYCVLTREALFLTYYISAHFNKLEKLEINENNVNHSIVCFCWFEKNILIRFFITHEESL